MRLTNQDSGEELRLGSGNDGLTFRVNNSNDIIMYCAKAEKTSEHILARFNNTDIHIMNKKSIERNINEFLDCGSVR